MNNEIMPRHDRGSLPVGCDVCDGGGRDEENASLFGCGSSTAEARWGIKGYPLSMVYAPLQEWRSLYDLDTALKRGTLFSELDLPFLGSGCKMGGGKNA